MISFSFSTYKLVTPQLQEREGVLLRFQFANGSIGYGDCFPWPELGDPSLHFHLEELRHGRLTTLTRQSLLCAERDAQFRARNVNTLNLVPKVKNHFLVTSLPTFESLELHRAVKQGFETFKIKVGRNLVEEATKIRELFQDVKVKLRLDFNSKATLESFAKFAKDLGPAVAAKVEFVEDPFLFEPLAWHQASQILPLAADHELKNVDWNEFEKPPFSVVVIKPARQNVDKLLDKCLSHNLKFVVTSSLDHPLSVIAAATIAGELKRDYPDLALDSGCLSFHAYQPTLFSQSLHLNGPIIESVLGSGFGFDEILNQMTWQNNKSQVRALINPKLSLEEQKRLSILAESFPQPDGVWIASSGSSSHIENSVKFVALSEKALLASAKAVNQHLQVTQNDVWIQVLPEFHVGGLGIEYRAECAGSKIVKLTEKWDPSLFVKACNEHAVTLASLVPTQIYDLLNAKMDVPASIRAILIGGAAMSETLYFRARKAGWPVLPSYGMTEAASTVAAAPLASLKEVTSFPAFHVLSHITASINLEGLIDLEGESLLTGYAQWIDDRAQWFSPLSRDGVLHTEDVGEMAADGLRIFGRRGDFVKILGEGVNLARLREILDQMGCRQTYLLDSPDDRRGAELSLVFENTVPVQERKSIFENFNQKVAPYERLQCIQVVERIPRSILGKVLKSELLLSLSKDRRF